MAASDKSEFTKTLFGLGLKEWRIEMIYPDRGDSSVSHYRVIAHNENEAFLILMTAYHGDDLDRNYEKVNISDAESKLDDICAISGKYDGIPAPTAKCPGVWDIDPFDGELTLRDEYPDGFVPKWADEEDDDEDDDDDDDDDDGDDDDDN